MQSPKRYLVTSALPYANGPIHIGHLAGAYLPADIYVRYLRAKGKDVVWVCGSDEHGMAITIKARKEGVTPREVVDRYHVMMKNSFEEFGISFDHYSRTSGDLHKQTASDFFKTLYDKGSFVEKETEQYYDEEAGQFLADRYITGTCPVCAHDAAYGDQCEKCGSTLNPTDLINPKSTLSGAVPVLKKTMNWFLPLDKLSPQIREYLDGHKDWKTNVYGQCKSWLDAGDGLQPRSMTRDLDWGVPVPVPGAEGKVLYVWFDAPIGYISATKEWAAKTGKNWETYWKDGETQLVHFIGKDNIVFHCIIFPAILMEHGGYVLADSVPANEFLNLEGEKISTSRNWAVWLHEYLQEFPGKQDVLRYALCANAPETKDNDFTWKDFQARNNNELVAILGNFVNRTLVLTHKFYNGVVPESGTVMPEAIDALAAVDAQSKKIAASIEKYRFREALQEMMEVARIGNKFLAEKEPWKMVKTDAEGTATVMHTAIKITEALCILMQPFLPFSTIKLAGMLNLPEEALKDFPETPTQNIFCNTGHKLGEAALLFEKIEDTDVEFQVAKLVKPVPVAVTAPAANVTEPAKPEIVFDDFMKMDMRVATVKSAEYVPKTDKLMKLVLDTGVDERTVVSGIAEHYTPEDVVGRQVCVLLNLAPRKMKGIESRGMILMAKDADGKLVFMSPAAPVKEGSGVA